MEIMTLGYEGSTLKEVMDCMIKNGVEVLVDIRELPLSRKAGFSKTPLSNEAASRGIAYLNIRALGCPREIRHDYHKDHDWEKYSIRYLQHLATQTESLENLAKLARERRCCLLCFEADARYCHRRYIAEHLLPYLEEDASVKHLVVKK